MKKKTGLYDGVCGRKKRLTRIIWIVLILIFSIISISATGAENNTESEVSDKASPERNTYAGNDTGSQESIKAGNETEVKESAEEKLDQKTEESNSTESYENINNQLDPNTEVENGTENPESEDGNPKQKTEKDKGLADLKDEVEENQEKYNETDSQKSKGSDQNSKEEIGNETEVKENIDKNSDQKTEESNNTENYENINNQLDPNTEVENGTENPESEDGNPKQKTEEDKDSADLKDKAEEKQEKYNETESQENIKKDQNTEKYNETESKEHTVDKPEQKKPEQKKPEQKKPEQKKETNPNTENLKSKEFNLKLKVKAENKTDIQKNIGTKTELKTKTCDCTKNQKKDGIETEQKVKVCNLTKSLENAGVKPEEIRVCNWTHNPENGSVIPEIKTEKNSWNNLKFILSYPYPLRSFYTVNESVKISYKGPEALGQQNVDIYLVKVQSSSYPENIISNGMSESAIRFEDILNNTESYIQIPAVLNKGGDLSPLTLGPLSAGSYWVLITLEGNEMEKTESEKEILLANYFEVLEYTMEARIPYTVKEGENLDVRLNLKNAPAEKSYTYWAVLIKEGAYKEYGATSPSWTTSGTRPIVSGVDIVRSLETNLTEYNSRAGKDEFKKEIQTLIGKGNGTIIIGEENQSTLSLNNLELPPGDYLLLTGAYGDNEGLAGIAKKELRISAENSYQGNLKSSSGNSFVEIPSMKNRASSFMGIKTLLETPQAFIFEDIKPYIQAKEIVEIVRNPPKTPSFLLGFAGTLLIGLVILRKNR
ncbi:MAG: TIGR04279 domain-containing protein [Methanosarcina sp.]